ncbi:MAG: thioredoxin [Bacteroidia bacterium]
MTSWHKVPEVMEPILQESYTRPVVVDFWAQWCGPCRMLSPILDKLAAESHGQWRLYKINIEEYPEVASYYHIHSIPNVKLFWQGEIADEFLGALPESQIRQWLRAHLQKTDPAYVHLQKAQNAYAQNDYAQARYHLGIYRKEHPQEPEGLLLDALLRWNEEPEYVKEILSTSKPLDSLTAQKVEALRLLVDLLLRPLDQFPESPIRDKILAAIEAIRQKDYTHAIERVLEVLVQDKKYDNELPRRLGVALFVVLGDKHPVTQTYRRKFDMALY